jgi:drug/metabolite transporter (DMT)-like permease
MIYLIISILCAASLVVILKGFEKFNIQTTNGIVWNYLTCAIFGFLLIDYKPAVSAIIAWEGLPFVVILGVLFFSIFNLIGISTHLLGVATTSIAFKLAFIIPVIAAIILYDEPLTILKIAIVVLAMIAVILVSRQSETNHKKHFWHHFLPLIIFFFCGLGDSIFNYVQKIHYKDGWDHTIVAIIFAISFSTGFLFTGYKKSFWQSKNIVAGIVLGIPNYASLYFLLLALQHAPLELSVLFPMYNLGIILTGVFMGIVLFKEKLDRIKILGLVIALISLIIMTRV